MYLSIVTTLYRSEQYIEEFYRRVTAVAEKITNDYEIIFVNDGSPDGVLPKAIAIHHNDTHVKVIDFSRNFGHHRAIMSGLQQSTGEYVFLIDVDLEESPEILEQFFQKLKEDESIDVIHGQLQRKEQNFLRNFLSKTFYLTFNALSPFQISDRDLVARLMTRRYVNALLEYTERELFLPAVWKDVGFNQIAVPARKQFSGNSSYTLKKRLLLAVDAITSFSSRPLILVFFMGAITSIISLGFIIYLIVRKLFFTELLSGWASLIASIYLMGGLIMLSLGIVGIYISKVYIEIKQRPYSVVKKIYE